MPTYLYECEKCGRFEEFQKITDDPLSECPHCGGEEIRRIIGNPGVIFKGAGFYSTDNRKKKSSTPAGNGKEKKPETAKDDNDKEEKVS